MVVIKRSRQKHFTKNFGLGTVSHRIVLPGRDNCRVKVTKFNPRAGFNPGSNVVHNTDEVVYVLEGSIMLGVGDLVHHIRTGGLYFVPAGTPTSISAIQDSRLLCVFFPAEGGPLPNDE